MQLSNSLKSEEVNPVDGIAILDVVESFLVRRAICGHEPTGLHAVFKKLWTECMAMPTAAKVTEEIRKHRTVVWPNNEEVMSAVRGRALYGSSVTGYVLSEWNRSLGGDQPGIPHWIEHVLPDKPDKEWFELFTVHDHEKMRHLLANLLPLSQEMNQSLGNAPYSQKRQVYLNDSGFKATRKFAEEYTTWTPKQLGERSDALASWVVNRWRY